MLKYNEAAAHVAEYNLTQRPLSIEQQAAKLLACVQAARSGEPYLISARARANYAETIAKLKQQHADLAAVIGELNAKMEAAAQLLSEV